MDVRFALKRQYRAALLTLRECVERASPEVWLAGAHPRNFWRIAYHATYYTDLYLCATAADFVPPTIHRPGVTDLWNDADPPIVKAYSQEEVLDYLDRIDSRVGDRVDRLNLDDPSSGFDWYPDMGKFEHQLSNLRHLQTHVGQLSELLMASGVESDFWISKA